MAKKKKNSDEKFIKTALVATAIINLIDSFIRLIRDLIN